MNKAELIDAIAEELDLSKAAAERAVNGVLDNIKKGVKDSGSVQLIGFGTFELKHRKAREGRNPRTGETMQIPASKSVGFKPGKQFKEEL